MKKQIFFTVLFFLAAIFLDAWLIRKNPNVFPPAAKIAFGVVFLLILFEI